MTFTISKTKLAVAIIAVAMIIPSSAMAFHVFDDVPDDKFYAEPVEWAFDNGITTGKSPTMFAPDDGVTRGESVTFLKRYNDNVVEPTTMNLFASDSSFTNTTSSGDLGLSASVTIPEGHTGVIEVGFSAESSCYDGGPGPTFEWCTLTLKMDGAAVDAAGGNFAFDSDDSDNEGQGSYESHAMTRVTEELGAGTYEFTADSSVSGTNSFWLDEMVLTAQVHLTS